MSRLHLAVVGLLVVGCAGAAPSPSPSSTPNPSDSGSPTTAPSPSPSPTGSTGSGIYLRAWQTQALPPPSSFTSGPFVTVADGVVIDNNVAVPAIFPGPLLILPNARPISPAGEQQIVDELNDLGLLDGGTDFTGGRVMPGGATGHLLVVVDGTRHELTGDPSAVEMCGDRPCQVDPASPQAFGAFWWLLGNSDAWLGGNLGSSQQYRPARLALLVGPVGADNSGIAPNKQTWPLADFARFGEPYDGMADTRCAVVEGDDLATLLPILAASNQLTIFVDSNGEQHSLSPRALVPLEDSPCATGQ